MHNHLETENFSLRQQLETLLQEARRNEDKMRRFDQLERQLIGASSLVELVRLLLSEYKSAFMLEHVTLTLVDREYEATRILETELGSDALFAALTLIQSPAPLIDLYGGNRGPLLGAYFAELHQQLFQHAEAGIASVALLPLTRQGELIGSLHFGSSDRERYDSRSGTQFLERLGAIISVCLESALNQERLKLVGLTDGLTGVQNRRYFEHRCQVEISHARRHQHQLACMFLDVDRFKSINDTHGHQAGDEVLRSVAGAILQQLRAGDTVARYGGEEFVVLLPQTSSRHAAEVAERIRATIARKQFQIHSGNRIEVTISIGLAMLPTDDAASDARPLSERMIAAADQALYQAKNSGRNRVVCAGSQLAGGAALDGATPFAARVFPELQKIVAAFSAQIKRLATILQSSRALRFGNLKKL